MMGRPTKYNDERAGTIVERLRQGCTRKAAYLTAGISDTTFENWLRRNLDFLEAVARAEAEAEIRNTAIIQKAAVGYDTGHTTRTTKTVFKVRETTLPDGTVIKEPVALQEVTEAVTTGREFDPKYALEWLKRRRPEEWGDTMVIEVWRRAVEKARGMSDDDLLVRLGYGKRDGTP